jgi:hypothetical protein
MTISDNRFETLKGNYGTYLPYLSTLHADFGGPSIYFHQQALLEKNTNFLSDRHIEMTYATLSSWGMHRMGATKTKMTEFSQFRSAILDLRPQLEELKFARLEDFSSEPKELLDHISKLCFKLKVSISDSKIVGNSKALAHILPNIVPPVDRQYTIRFFSEKLNNFKGQSEEQDFYNHILRRCYQFVHILNSDDSVVLDKCFNTSLPKIFDNLIMLSLKKENGA